LSAAGDWPKLQRAEAVETTRGAGTAARLRRARAADNRCSRSRPSLSRGTWGLPALPDRPSIEPSRVTSR
jgi:hypothetical protein